MVMTLMNLLAMRISTCDVVYVLRQRSGNASKRTIRHSIVASIPACHIFCFAIPRDGVSFVLPVSTLISSYFLFPYFSFH